MHAAPALDSPPHTIRPFRGPIDTVRTMIAHIRGARGERSVLVRGLTEHVVRGLQPKDYLSEIVAIRNYVTEKVRYANDALTTEWVKDPQRMVEEIAQHGATVGDCFVEGTLVLADGHQLLPIESLRPGMKIWGLDRWSTVGAVAYKGALPVDLLQLNNGSEFALTSDHHVYALECPRHALPDDPDRKGCSCPVEERQEARLRVSDLRPRMVLAVAPRLPFGTSEMDPDRAYVEGLYVSDGWSDQNSRFCISGQDGSPKEEQKKDVQRICERVGSATRWHRKYIAVNDGDWALRMHQMGRRAPDKRLLSLNLDEAPAAATLRGVMADSGKNTRGPGRTFTTTSRRLAVQLRVLHRMFGTPCGWRYVPDHGGLGPNPIWRLGTRGEGEDRKKAPSLLRVRRIDREVAEAPCWDIQTDDHRVYLPEHDVTVSQCDDQASLILTMCRQLGREGDLVIVGFGRPGHYSHVFCRVREPKSGKHIVLDPVAGTDEAKMLRRVTTYKVYGVD